MFWSGNYIAVRELNSLLKEENVTLSQVLEADDILQECKADNKALMLFLTRPDILNELITLITEEPPKNVELSAQYRHANIACEVLTSHLSMLSDRLSSDIIQMNRLCDFVNREPPLNPLLASYFSKTVEMLLEKSPKQDCYLYHIVCLRVLDFFKSRRDFLPNLLRHISTSAIADVFKYFIRLDDLFNKIVMEWLEEHQFLECLIQIVTGNYVTEGERTEPDLNHNQGGDEQRDHQGNKGECEGEGEDEDDASRVRWERRARVSADNACGLLVELVGSGCGVEGGAGAWSRTALALSSRLGSAAGVSLLLGGAFTSPAWARPRAVAHAAALLARLQAVEPALAPHLPLLHRALTHPPGAPPGVGSARLQIAALIAGLVSSPVQEVCTALLALGTPAVLVDLLVQYPDNNFLHASVVAMVRNALNNAVYRTQYAEHLFVECDLLNRIMDLYEENENKELSPRPRRPRRGHSGHVCQLATVCADATTSGAVTVPRSVQPRWDHFLTDTVAQLQQMLDTPLGGTHPADCKYEVDCIMDTLAANFDFSDMAATGNMEEMGEELGTEHEMGGVGVGVVCTGRSSDRDSPASIAAGLGLTLQHDHDLDIDDHKMNTAKSNFLELASQRFDDDMWDETPEGDGEGDGEGGDNPLDEFSPWSGARTSSCEGEEEEQDQWAQFASFTAPPVDPFAPPTPSAAPTPAPAPPPLPQHQPAGGEDFAAFWPYQESGSSLELEERLRSLDLEEHQSSLANNLLTAMSGMSPAALARLVGHNLDTIDNLSQSQSQSQSQSTGDDRPKHDNTTLDRDEPTIPHTDVNSLADDITHKIDNARNKADVPDDTDKSTVDTSTGSIDVSSHNEAQNKPVVPDGTDSEALVIAERGSEGNEASSSCDSTTDVHSMTGNEAAKIDSPEPKIDSKDDDRPLSEKEFYVEDIKSEIKTESSSAIDNEPSVVENEVEIETSER